MEGESVKGLWVKTKTRRANDLAGYLFSCRLEGRQRPGQVAYAIAFTRAERRETLREAVFLWVTPLVTERMISG